MKTGDLVRIKASQHIAGSAVGVITSKKGCGWPRKGSGVFWVLIDGVPQTYDSSQLVKIS